MGRGGGDGTLWQFARHGFFQWFARVSSTGHTHRLIYIGTARQRVTDCTTQAGSCAAEWFNFCWMVVGFVFEHKQPFFCAVVGFHIHFYATGVDFFTLIQIFQHAPFFQRFGSDGCHVHHGNWTGFCSFAVHFFTGSQIFFIAFFHQWIIQSNVCNLCHKGGMTAVIRPVGVNHFQFGDGWIPLFFIAEITLHIAQVTQIHSQTILLTQFI